MHNGIFRKGAVAALAVAVVSMAAWKAPQASSYLSGASGPAISIAPAGVPAVVASSSDAPIVAPVETAVVTIRVEKRAQMIPTDQQIPAALLRTLFCAPVPRGQ